MFTALTATKAVMLLTAIFMPIVHKNSFKRAITKKIMIKPFIDRQLFIFLEYIFILVNNNKTNAIPIPPHIAGVKLFNKLWEVATNH